MVKFAKRRRAAAPTSPVLAVAPAWTYEGGAGFTRDAKSELFLLAVTNFAGEQTFYEPAPARDARFATLVARVAGEDPNWLARFVGWLRGTAHMRSAAAVMACEYVRAGGPNGRRVIASACLRADEPAEILAYWTARYGRNVPQPVKRGVADAATRLYTERAALRYDGTGRAWRLADVLELAHPKPADERQAALFRWLLDRRHDRADARDPGAVPAVLGTVRAWLELHAVPVEQRRALLVAQPERIAAAGMSWETASAWLEGPLDTAAWTALVPSMGYMARLRNLRNFDDVGMDDGSAARVAASLADPAEVARSRQLPYRFLSAYLAVSSVRWHAALEHALQAATGNVPELPGRTLVLVDTSASMNGYAYSAKSTVTPARAAALFGVALAVKGADVDLVGFADGTFTHEVRRGGSVLREVERFVARTGEVGHGTRIAEAVHASYRGHDRVVILTDMQTFAGGRVTDAVPRHVPMYGFNLVGYGTTAIDAGGANRHEFGGLTDATFTLLSMVERGERADWPF
jgi:hypothetical protein